MAGLPSAVTSRFSVHGPFATGTTGALYRATDTTTGKEGVLKIVSSAAQLTPSERGRLVREMEKLVTLHHPSIAQIHAAGTADDTPWLFRELVEGESLQARLARGPMLAPEALGIAAQIASGLDELHRAGLLQRDLSPAHVILRSEGAQAVLIDSGIAGRIAAPGLFEVSGKPEYVSPEHAQGKLVSFRSDLYSLGAVLYEMATGTPVYTGGAAEVLEAQRTQPPPTPPPGTLPSNIAALLAQLLQKEPRERPFSAQQVRRALEPFLPVGAAGPPPGAAAKKTLLGVPSPTSKRADQTEELSSLDIARAETILRGPPPAPTSPPAAPRADATMPLTAVDLARAEALVRPKAAPAPAALKPNSMPPPPPAAAYNTSSAIALPPGTSPGIQSPPVAVGATGHNIPAPPPRAPAPGGTSPAVRLPPPVGTSPGIAILKSVPPPPPPKAHGAVAQTLLGIAAPVPSGVPSNGAHTLMGMAAPPPVSPPSTAAASATTGSGAHTLMGMPTPPQPAAAPSGVELDYDDLAETKARDVEAHPIEPAKPPSHRAPDPFGPTDPYAPGAPSPFGATAAVPSVSGTAPQPFGVSAAQPAAAQPAVAMPVAAQPAAASAPAAPYAAANDEVDELPIRRVPMAVWVGAGLVSFCLVASMVGGAVGWYLSSGTPGAVATIAPGAPNPAVGMRPAMPPSVPPVVVPNGPAANGPPVAVPPAVTPPTITPPVVTPPTVAPAIIEPPVVAPPTVTPPTVTPAVITPIVTPPVITPAEEARGGATGSRGDSRAGSGSSGTRTTDGASGSSASSGGSGSTSRVGSGTSGSTASSGTSGSSGSSGRIASRIGAGSSGSSGSSGASGSSASSGAGFDETRARAAEAFRARRYADAERDYLAATRLNPRHAGSWAGLGASRLAQRNARGAVEAYRQAVSIQPSSAGFHAALGRALAESGDRSAARREYEEALRLDSDNRDARIGLERL